MLTNKFEYLYVEPSSYCALECPRCPRTYDKKNYKLSHLNKDVFMTFISCSFFKKTRCIEFGGNYGDPIFHPHFEDLIKIAKNNCPEARLIVHTSGHRDPAWWKKIVSLLDKKDSVLFSIDGLKDTNHLYKQKSNWTWIENAIDICSGNVYLAWKFIIFKHNQHQIREAISFAKNKGVNEFILTKSGLFNGEWSIHGMDPLAPSMEWIAPTSAYTDVIDPKCQKTSRHYLSADGFYSPCCWMDFSREYSIDVSKLIADNQTVDDVFLNPMYKKLSTSWNQTPSRVCLNKCSQKIAPTGRSSHSQLTLFLNDDVNDIDIKLSDFAGSRLDK